MSTTKGSSTTMTHLRRLRLVILATTIVATALVLVACGSSSKTSSASSSGSAAAGAAPGGAAANRSKLVACLKAHGVTLPKRPAGAGPRANGGEGGGFGGGGGFFGGGGANGGAGGPGARFNNPKFRAAIQACGGNRFPQRRFEPNKAAVTKFVVCVKQHGFNLPTPNFSGKGAIFPAAIARNKKFQAAARACASDLRPRGAPGAPGQGGPGGAGGGG
jgi:hypothetical protein